MKQILCPVNGLRPLQEFQYGGALRDRPDPDTCSDEAWADYVFNRAGAPGVQREWWCHVPSAVWFVAERDTLNDVFLRTYLYEEMPDRE